MPLPAIIRAEFEYVNPATTQESDYYGAYNILLGHAFLVADGFVVHPQVRKSSKSVSQVAPIFSSARR